MAKISPDRIPSKASQGEKDTYELLKRFPDNYWVYYQPIINKQHPDFIVIAPDLGIIVIEVKGWRIGDIRGVDNNEVIVVENHRMKSETHPLTQAWKYLWELYGICENDPRVSALLNHEGKYKNKIGFPFCHLVVLSNITRDNIDRIVEQDLYKVFNPEKTIFRDQMLHLKKESSEKIRSVFENFFYSFWKINPLTEEQVMILRTIIHPQIVLEDFSPPSQTALESDTHLTLQVLDERQENNAFRIGEWHRIIYGVAGSGKTVLLIARSKILHDRDPDAKILLLCYNVSLCAFLRGALKKYPKINVMHFDGWAKHNKIYRRSKDHEKDKVENDESLGKRLLEHLQHQNGDYRTYDVIMIDEAQDFPSIWFSCI
jgi:hypothetical protein